MAGPRSGSNAPADHSAWVTVNTRHHPKAMEDLIVIPARRTPDTPPHSLAARVMAAQDNE